jgi:hypothetical protein
MFAVGSGLYNVIFAYVGHQGHISVVDALKHTNFYRNMN